MHERRFWCDEFDQPGNYRLPPDEAHHAVRTLRLAAGDPVALLNGRGATGYGRIQSVQPTKKRDCAVVVTLDSIEKRSPPMPRLTLIVAECKGERLDWMIEKCTELSVGRIWLTEFDRSVVHAGPGKLERLGRIARQACKQSGAGWLPEIRAGLALQTEVAAFAAVPHSRCYAADPGLDVRGGFPKTAKTGSQPHPTQVLGIDSTLFRVLCGDAKDLAEIAVIVGPEGGMSEREIAKLRELGIPLVRLTSSILRVETAAIAIAALVEGWAAK